MTSNLEKLNLRKDQKLMKHQLRFINENPNHTKYYVI